MSSLPCLIGSADENVDQQVENDRRGKVRLVAIDDSAAGVPDRDGFRHVLDRDEAIRAIASLDDDLRIVILLHYWVDLTLEGVADRVGWPVGTVKSRLHRALAQMRGQLESPALSEEPR